MWRRQLVRGRADDPGALPKLGPLPVAVGQLWVKVEAVTVEIVESDPTAKAKGGVLFSEMRR